MKIKSLSLSLLPAMLFIGILTIASTSAVRADDAVKTIAITCGDNLRFDVAQIQASPGEKLHVTLLNKGTMPKATMGHNWILLDSMAEATQYATSAIAARDVEYQPKALQSHVLAYIPLLGPKESGEVTFTAPTKPGKYPYICSCSGHALAGMKGELIVK